MSNDASNTKQTAPASAQPSPESRPKEDVRVGGFTSHTEDSEESLDREQVKQELADGGTEIEDATDDGTNDPDDRYDGNDPYREPIE